MHILLVEDNRDDASLLSEFIAEEENPPSISWVIDGQEALDYVFQKGKFEQAIRPDVIVLDLALPRLNGYEALQALKGQAHYASIPVIVLSTSHSSVDSRNCIELGADGFFSKPSSLQGYVDLVQKFMRHEFPRLLDMNCSAGSTATQ